MFKKSLIATAILGVVASGAMAADVEVYGRIDTGFAYTHEKETTNGTSVSTDKFSMDSGNSTGSRWGLRGSEDLGDGLKVGFVLENGFSSDTGALGDSRLFNRESTLWIEGGFGRVYAGRMSGFMSDAGSVGFWGGLVSPFGTGWGNLAGHAAVMAGYETTRFDNAIAYVSPKFAGVTVYAMYGMGSNDENESTSDRYAALGASYINGPVQVAAVVDYLNKRSVGEGKFDGEENVQMNGFGDPDDAWTFNIGGAYDFEVAKVYGAVQYFKNAVDIGGIMSDDDDDTSSIFAHSYSSLDGFGVNIGADVPLAGGLFKVSAGYMDGEVNDILYAEDDGSDVEGYNIMAGYEYPFSKRTNVYVGAGYTKYKYEATDETGKYEIFQAMFGLVHKF